MGVNAGKHLEQLKQIVPGDGFKVVKPISYREFHLASDGATLTTTISTNPGWDKLGTNMTGLAWAAAKVVAAGITLQIPDDYDEDADSCIFRLKAKMSGSADTPNFGVAAYLDSAPTTDLAPDDTVDLSDTVAWVDVNLSGNSFVAGDIVQLAITPESHGTDAIEIYGQQIEYKSCIVKFSNTSR